MTKTEAISTITAQLPALSEEQLQAIAEVTAAWTRPAEPFQFTAEEKAGIQRSLEDFQAGRTLTLDEAEARTKTFLAARRATI